jgi:hypothetical protein
MICDPVTESLSGFPALSGFFELGVREKASGVRKI